MASDDSPVEITFEGDTGSLRAVLILNCPNCRTQTRFTAEDERPDGSLVCVCGYTVEMTQDRLSAVQANLDDINRAFEDLVKSIESFSRSR